MEMIFSISLTKGRLILLGLFLAFTGLSQDLILIRGQVLDAQTGQPIAEVRITVHETEKSVLSNVDGRFELLLQKGHYHLHFERRSYRAQDLDLELTMAQNLSISLLPSAIELEELLIEDGLFNQNSREFSQQLTSLRTDLSNQSASVDLGVLLSKEPGVQALNTGVGISKPIIRGFTGNRVTVLDQGIKQEGQQWGMDHGLEIDPFQVQRMELVKGPAALQYGSDAIGGVLRILPDALPQKKWNFQLQSNYHSNNQAIGYSGSVAYRKGALSSGIRLSRRQYHDFRVPAEQFVYNSFVLPITDNTLKNTAGYLQSAQAYVAWNKEQYRARYRLSVYDQKQGLYPGATGVPRAFDVGNIGSTSDINLPFQQIRHYKLYSIQNVKIGNHWLEAELGYQWNDREERSLPHNHGFEELDSGATLALGLDLQSFQSNFRYRFHWQGQDFIAGLSQQWRQNRSAGFEYLIPDYSAFQSGLYLLSKGQRGEKLFWDGGLRWEFVNQNSPLSTALWWNNIDSIVDRSPAINRNFSNLAIAAGLVYLPSANWQFKLHLARSFRPPNVAELSSNGVHHGTFRHEVGDPGLDPELAWQGDLSLEFRTKELLLQVASYYYYFENYIFLRPTAQFSLLPEAGQLYVYQQAPIVQGGGEIYLDWHPWANLHLGNGAELLLNRNLNTQLPLPFSPPWSNLTSLKWEEDKWYLGLEWRYTWAQERVDRNEAATPNYHLFNLNLGFHWEWRNQEFQANAQLRNAFDTAYLRHLSRYRILNLPEQGRNLVIGLAWKL